MAGAHEINKDTRRAGSHKAGLAIAIAIACLSVAGAILIVGSPANAEPQKAAPPAPKTQVVDIYLTSAEDLIPVGRTITLDKPAIDGAVNALLAGPTSQEVAQGYGTDIPAGTRLLSAKVETETRTAIIDLSSEFAKVTPNDPTKWTELGRVHQVVLTTQAAVSVDNVQILIEGKPHVEDSVTKIEAPTTPKPVVKTPPPAKSVAPVATIRDAQQKLVELKYLPSGAVTGVRDYRTQQAVMAFQAWEGLQRDGDVGPQTTAALKKASAPVPAKEGIQGKSLQIYRAKGVVLLVNDGQLVRAIHTSTGKPGYTTPPGKYKIYRKAQKDWSNAYSVWLPYAQYFVGGYALHEYADVPPQPASHGCARLPSPEAPVAYDFTVIGTPVAVY